MPDVFMETSVKFGLRMTISEAKWLKAVMQNSFDENESEENYRMRRNFFNALREAGVDNYREPL